MAPSFRAFSCMGGLDANYNKYDEKPNYLGEVLCDYNEQCDFTNFLNKKYGANNWEFDDNFYIKYPKLFENSGTVQITTGTKNESTAEIYTRLSIIVEGHISVKGDKNSLTPSQREKQILKVADINFSKNAYLHYSTRLKFPLPNPVVNIYAMYTNKDNTMAKITKPPHLGAGSNNGCKFNVYIK